METSWRATLLGRGPGERGGALSSAGSQGGAGTAMLRRCLQVVAARPCSIGQTGWPDRGLRLRLRMGMKVVMWARVRTHTHTHTHTRMGYWGGCWIGSRKVGRGCGRRSGMGSGFVFARRSTRCVRGLPRGSRSLSLSIYPSEEVTDEVVTEPCASLRVLLRPHGRAGPSRRWRAERHGGRVAICRCAQAAQPAGIAQAVAVRPLPTRGRAA